ncbi:MAG TPA: SDR family oxidoreductase [Baekduia sp.]|uniref:SDR family NAD(P)-dependent oxidoreductase n=1 Tax=Baekduia sp. TaxID=2600305 RepID=UPI002D78A909|nr:SDR family oxidoreductase [Baekduia sp.]HET6509940.1 SDR family oxidoreductase [Baekduia sp.]
MRGSTVLVTGGSRGLGRMTAVGLAERGARVLVTSRAPDGPRDLAGAGCVPLHAELGTEAGCRALADAVAARVGDDGLDVLINNAGTTIAAPLEAHDDAVWDAVVDLNLKAVFHLTRMLVPSLRAAARRRPPARVINIGSVSGLGVPRRDNYSYVASKGGMHHMTRHLALMLGPDVACNAIAPGVFRTELSERMPAEYTDTLLAGTPAGRMGTPDDLLGAIVYLASPAGSFLTGTVLALDGGMSLTTLGA